MGRKKSGTEKRFVVGLQTDNPCCYKDFFDSDKLPEAQMMATNAAKRECRKALVWDRQGQDVAFRCDYTVPAASKEQEATAKGVTPKTTAKERVKRK